MRVRSMQMNDAHIYCTLDQFEEEFLAVCRMYLGYFDLFGIDKYVMRFSTHDPADLGKKYVDEPELWLETEERVRRALANGGINHVEVAGEAAFYGPKIDVEVWSAIGREFSIATNQVDFAVPARYGLVYTSAEGAEETPICIHRAPLGTHERTIGFLIEHYAGAFPTWLAPVQAVVLPIAERPRRVRGEGARGPGGGRCARRAAGRPEPELPHPRRPEAEGAPHAGPRGPRGGGREGGGAPAQRGNPRPHAGGRGGGHDRRPHRRSGARIGSMGKGLRRQARILWRFRFHLLCAAAALVLWETPWIKPFRVFVVMVHEMCHAVAALVTGGEVLEMRTAWAEHGYTLSRGGWPLIIVSAGYVGSALLGAGLIWSGVLPQLQRLALLLVGAVTLGMTLAFTPAGGLDFVLGIAGGLALICTAVYSARAGSAGAVWLGVMLCLYSLHDFRTDLWLYAERTDAGILAAYLGLPWLAYPIAAAWVWLSLWVMYRAMASLVKHEASRT